MCGIFGYLGSGKTAGQMVVAGLQKLEYRGYDSFGFVAANERGQFSLTRKVGKISEFAVARHKFVPSGLALGHTRWATHGGVTTANAHPHLSACGLVAVVHNGIVENHAQIRKELEKKGVRFASQTDTEVIPNLIAAELAKKCSLAEAVRKAAARLTGRFAFVAAAAGRPELIVARRGSPLILGVADFAGQREKTTLRVAGSALFVASDVPAFLEHTRDIVYLDDNELAELAPTGAQFSAQFFTLATGSPVKKRVVSIELATSKADKGGFEHFMLKEIFEQKETVARAVQQDEKSLQKVASLIQKARGTFLVGCGTAGKVCHTAEYLFARVAGRHVNTVFGSEFDCVEPFLTAQSLLVAVSQSGETADILEAYEVARRKKAATVGVVNVEGSSIARQSTVVLPVRAGPEKAVASTKATTAQLAILTLLAYTVAGRLDEGRHLLRETAAQISDLLNPRYSRHLAALAKKIHKVESLYIIGKAENYPMALEAAIKLQEVSYIHAEGFAAGELKHGPLALIARGTPLIAFVPGSGSHRAEVLSNVSEVRARGGRIIGVSPVADDTFHDWIRVPDAGLAQPIVNILPIQLLAYHLAVLRKNNPDLPRNLAKSVTVK